MSPASRRSPAPRRVAPVTSSARATLLSEVALFRTVGPRRACAVGRGSEAVSSAPFPAAAAAELGGGGGGRRESALGAAAGGEHPRVPARIHDLTGRRAALVVGVVTRVGAEPGARRPAGGPQLEPARAEAAEELSAALARSLVRAAPAGGKGSSGPAAPRLASPSLSRAAALPAQTQGPGGGRCPSERRPGPCPPSRQLRAGRRASSQRGGDVSGSRRRRRCRLEGTRDT